MSASYHDTKERIDDLAKDVEALKMEVARLVMALKRIEGLREIS